MTTFADECRVALLPYSDPNMCPKKTFFSYGPNVFLTTCSKESRKQKIVFSQIVPDTEAKCSGCLFSLYLKQCDGGTHPSCALLIITLWAWHAFHWICMLEERASKVAAMSCFGFNWQFLFYLAAAGRGRMTNQLSLIE